MLGILLSALHSEFRACQSPEIYLAKATASKSDPQLGGQNVVLAGASNLGQCARYLANAGIKVTNLAKPGWVASKENIMSMATDLRKMTEEGCSAVVLDLYGNSSV